MNEIEYQEEFVRTTYNPEYVYRQVCEAYSQDLGWVVGEPTIEKLNEKEYKITIPLVKYKVDSLGAR